MIRIQMWWFSINHWTFWSVIFLFNFWENLFAHILIVSRNVRENENLCKNMISFSILFHKFASVTLVQKSFFHVLILLSLQFIILARPEIPIHWQLCEFYSQNQPNFMIVHINHRYTYDSIINFSNENTCM